jgi:hypothetical protein
MAELEARIMAHAAAARRAARAHHGTQSAPRAERDSDASLRVGRGSSAAQGSLGTRIRRAERMPARTSKSLAWVLLLCAGALGLRLWGLGWMLPHRVEPDSEIVAQTRILFEPERDKAWRFGTYGLVSAYTAALLPGPREVPPRAEMTLEEHRANAAAEVVRIRLAVTLLSLVIVPATWWLARQALGGPAALLAAALMATSLLHLSMSQQARPHGAACALMTVAVAAALHLRRRPTWTRYALAGLAAGLAAGALQSGLAVVPALFVAHFLRDKRESRTSFWRILLSLALLAALFALFYPLLIGRSTALFEVSEGRIDQGTHRVSFELFNGRGFPVMLWSLWSYEPTLLVLAACGLPIALARWPRAGDARRDLLVALVFALPYFLVFGVFQGFQERMLLPLLPYLAILSAFPLDAALKHRPGWSKGIVAAALLVLAVPTALAARLSDLRARDDTIEQCAAWVEEHLQPESDVALSTFPLDVPLFQDDDALAANRVIRDDPDFYPRLTRWFRYQAYAVQGRDHPLKPSAPRFGLVIAQPQDFAKEEKVDPALARIGARYALVELFPPEREVPGNTVLVEHLRSRGRRLARFAPWRDAESSDLPFEHEGLPSHIQAHVVRYLLTAERVGPVIEVYELR